MCLQNVRYWLSDLTSELENEREKRQAAEMEKNGMDLVVSKQASSRSVESDVRFDTQQWLTGP